MVEFEKKFTGAKAKLFAKACCRYSYLAEKGYCDKPSENPLFCWLSPYQRVFLVREVMIGLLCENEPLPRPTIQNYAAFCAVTQVIKMLIQLELDDCLDEDISEDLHDTEDTSSHRSFYTGEEQAKRAFNSTLIRDRAEKNKKKLDKKADDWNQEFESVDTERSIGVIMEEFKGISETIFAPLGPVRPSCRRPDHDEESDFYWRLLCEDAFKEGIVTPFFSLSFDFRCCDEHKWFQAIDFLFVTMSSVEITTNELNMVSIPINAASYADTSQHPRIQAVTRNVSVLRAMYDSAWKKDHLAEDQRCIFAVCAVAASYNNDHKPFVNGLLTKLETTKVPFDAVGNFQERLNVYREISQQYSDGLTVPFYSFCPNQDKFAECATPSEYEAEDGDIGGHCGAWCGNFEIPQDRLMRCSRCKVVLYCSRECQAKHWSTHKKDCKRLGELRKNKEVIAKMAKTW